jgi:hypothetical protein
MKNNVSSVNVGFSNSVKSVLVIEYISGSSLLIRRETALLKEIF